MRKGYIIYNTVCSPSNAAAITLILDNNSSFVKPVNVPIYKNMKLEAETANSSVAPRLGIE